MSGVPLAPSKDSEHVADALWLVAELPSQPYLGLTPARSAAHPYPPSPSQLESLSLALSHSLPPILASHRPALPAWALPVSPPVDSPLPAGTNLHPATPSLNATPDAEDTDAASQEGISYWTEVKQTLDREAEERVARRKAEWERRFKVAQAKEGGERPV